MAVLVYSNVTYVPLYKSTASIYILKQQDSSQAQMDTTDLDVSNKILADCSYIINSRGALDEVIKTLDLDYSHNELKNAVPIT